MLPVWYDATTFIMRRLLSFSFFLFAVTAILLLATAVVYAAAALAFDIVQPAYLLVLGGGTLFLSVSFIAATIIGNWYYNVFTRAYYLVSALWIGSLLYFFLASVAYGGIVAVSSSLAGIGPVLFLVALVASVYGLVHARKIVVTQVAVSLPNLPPTWRGRTALWISDLHLGQIHGPHFARRIVARVEALAPDIIFVGGDLYDGTGAPDLLELTAPLKKLSAPLGVYFITGNHEEYGDCERFLLAIRAAGMRTLVDQMVNVEGLQLLGVDYKNASDPARFKTILEACSINQALPSVLLKHEPNHLDVAAAAGVSLQISGHTHNAQQWPLMYMARRTYQGFAYGLKRFKNMQVYISSGVGTWGPPLRVGTDGEMVYLTFK